MQIRSNKCVYTSRRSAIINSSGRVALFVFDCEPFRYCVNINTNKHYNVSVLIKDDRREHLPRNGFHSGHTLVFDDGTVVPTQVVGHGR